MPEEEILEFLELAASDVCLKDNFGRSTLDHVIEYSSHIQGKRTNKLLIKIVEYGADINHVLPFSVDQTREFKKKRKWRNQEQAGKFEFLETLTPFFTKGLLYIIWPLNLRTFEFFQ